MTIGGATLIPAAPLIKAREGVMLSSSSHAPGTSSGLGHAPVSLERVVEFYSVPSPIKGLQLYVVIGEHEGELVYAPVEPALTRGEERLLTLVTKIISEEYVPENPITVLQDPLKTLRDAFLYALRRLRLEGRLPPSTMRKVFYYLYRNFVGYGPLEVLMRDPYVEDISVPGVGYHVYVWHNRYESLKTTIEVGSEDLMSNLLNRFAVKGRTHISTSRPIADAMTPEGFRAHLVLGTVAAGGGTITVRKFRAVPFTILELVLSNTLDINIAAYLWYLVENKRSIIIFGPTGAGKTTLLNAIAMLITPSMKVITIEETREINLLHPHWVPLTAPPGGNVTLYDLVRSSLRQRPDYIIVGEIRGEEAYVFFQAVATGHGGLTTMHAESLEAAVNRLTSPPMNVPLEHLAVVDALVHINRVRVRGRIMRRVVEIAEIEELDRTSKSVKFKRVFRWTGELTDNFTSERSLVLQRIAEQRVIDPSVVEREVELRKRMLEELIRRGTLTYADFAREVVSYYTGLRAR